jgi:hypothetical protein
MPTRGLRRASSVQGFATPQNAPVYVDSDDNKLKFIPAGSGTTEVELVDASTAQSLSSKTLASPAITGKPTVVGTSTTISGDGAIDISLGDDFLLTKGSAAAITLADPAAGDEGREITIRSGSAFAHVITLATGIGGVVTTDDVITFTNRASASIRLKAINVKWWVTGSYLAAIA